MVTGSNIEWTESTWNPVTGCTKITEGCRHCYAERMARRLKAMGQPNYRDGFKMSHKLAWTPNIWMGVTVENKDCLHGRELEGKTWSEMPRDSQVLA